MKRVLLWFFVLLLTLILVVPLSLYFVVRSEAGSRALLNWAMPLSPVALDFSDVQGTLLRGMTFSNFALESDALEIQADRLDIAWQPQMLWVGTLHLEHILIDNLVVNTFGQSSGDESGWPHIRLPIELSIDNFRLDGFRLNNTSPLQQMEFAGDMAGDQLRIDRLQLQRADGRLSMAGEVSLTNAYPLSMQIDWQFEFQDSTWEGAAQLEGDLERLDISHQLLNPYRLESQVSLSQQLPDSPGELALDRITVDGEHSSAELDLRDRLGEIGLISNFNLLTSGTIENLNLDLAGQIDLPWAGASQLSAVAHYAPQILSLERLGLETQRGQVVVAGFYSLDRQSVTLDQVSLTSFRLMEGLNALQAELQLQIDFSEALVVQGTVNEALLEQGAIALSSAGDFVYESGRLSSSELVLNAGSNQASIAGQLYPEMNLDWRLQGPELGDLIQAFTDLESAQAMVSGTGSVSGGYANPRVTAELEGEAIDIAGLVAEVLQIQIVDSGDHYQMELMAPTLNYAGREITNLESVGSYRAGTFDLETSLSLDAMDISARANGSKHEDFWSFELTQLDLVAPQPIGDWSMQQSLELDQTAAGWVASQACWVSAEDAGLCIQGGMEENAPGTVDLELSDLPLGFVDYLVVSPLRLDGRLDGNLHLEGIGPEFAIEAELRSEGGSFLVLGQEQTPDPVSYRQLSIAAEMQNQILNADASVLLGETSRAVAQGQLDFGSDQPQVDAELMLDMESIQWLEGVVTQIDSVSGNLVLNLNLDGPIRNPSIRANGGLGEASFIVPQAGIELSAVGVDIQAEGNNRIEVTASALSGGGQIGIEGVIDASEWQNLTAQFQIEGDSFQVLDRPDMRLVINPELQVTYSPELLDISGNLDIQEARARIRSLPEGGVRPSEDEVIIGQADDSERQLQTSLDLRIALGSQVEFEGFGLATGLTGELEIEQRAGEPQRSFGTIELVDGEYAAYGRTLSVQRGRMIFQGEFDNPALDVDAEQTYTDYTVGIHLGGTVQEPTTTLYSNPVMSQSDVLAVLLTGQKLDTMSASEAPTLLDAATRLGIVGGSSIAERIEENFGLSEFGVRNDNQNGQSLVAGTYVLPRLYVEWAQGLFEASSAVQLEYTISSQLRLKARSGASQSMDLIYEIETD